MRDSVPPYAILSHTWDAEEVTLQEMRRMPGRRSQALGKQKQRIADRKGFLKIKEAVAMAVKRGLFFIWVNTCCI